MNTQVIPSPISNLAITSKNNTLIKLTFTEEAITPALSDCSKRILNEIEAYFTNSTHTFNIDFELNGSTFQQKVWRALQTIDTGNTVTYGFLAKKLNTSARAIGQACRTNPIPLIIPCHRVVGTKDIGGFVGATEGKWLSIKQALLQHERAKSLLSQG